MKKCSIIGAGLVGSLLAVLLKKQGYEVSVYEKRTDPRDRANYSGRSINLALSRRGLRALALAELDDTILKQAIPMEGRMVHTSVNEQANLQKYSSKGECIYSISRYALNCTLIEQAERAGANFYFDSPFDKTQLPDELTFACDGIHSEVRKLFKGNRLEEIELSHQYMEFEISSEKGSSLFKNALHIWPNGHHMFIALPNLDGTFTCTLFLDAEGDVSFQSLKSCIEWSISSFFEKYYPELVSLIPDFVSQYQGHDASRLAYVKNSQWVDGKTILVGDAAHAIVPFYGQGMNAGFEDCRIIVELLGRGGEQLLLSEYFKQRKPNGDAICELALQNFVEMRDSVINPTYLALRKREAQYKKEHPDWLSLYEMVTFSDLDYAQCLTIGMENRKKMLADLNKG